MVEYEYTDESDVEFEQGHVTQSRRKSEHFTDTFHCYVTTYHQIVLQIIHAKSGAFPKRLDYG